MGKEQGRIGGRWRAALLAAALLWQGAAWATSTGGGTTRAVLVDGVVGVGATPGSNGPDWETDEAYQGYQGIINWYLTWDDDYLYLGRIGGNNAEGSVIYIKADYGGATFANRGFNYDALEPEASRMGGVNFAAYLKDSYHEYRTYNGSWSSATANTLGPSFSTQGNGANLEVAIPWSAVTNGNGRPNNIRLALYQVVPPGVACADEFVYGESPWGTGNVGDGPSVGVNDGSATSPRQPGGCGVGADTLERWWGCYPVMAGVGSNGWIAAMPYAGLDDTICETATGVALLGNQPPGAALGSWTVAATPDTNLTVTLTAPNDFATSAQGLDTTGTYLFTWDINYLGCPSVPDTVAITSVPAPPVAAVGPDTLLPCGANAVTLTANAPSPGTGAWSTTLGGGTVGTPTDSVTGASGLSPGPNGFTWTIVHPYCATTSATLTAFVTVAPTADAGPDLSLCGDSAATLAGNDPNLIQANANGAWLQLGPDFASIVNDTVHDSGVTGLVPGDYAFQWIVTNFPCPAAYDTMYITVDEPPIADAGGDQVLCLDAGIVLSGNDISNLGPGALGTWTQSAGPSTATIQSPNVFVTSVGNLVVGSYTFAWTVQNGVCPVASDQVQIDVNQVQANGILQATLPDSGMANGSFLVAQPVVGQFPYSYSIDGLNFQASYTFDSLASGSYTVVIMDANGCVDSLDYFLAYNPPVDTVDDSLVVPTGFSPNADGVNDFWELPGIEHYPDAQVEVFNIWGGSVFRSVGAYQPWNGQRNGQDLPSANYYFIIDLRAAGEPIRKGSLTILR